MKSYASVLVLLVLLALIPCTQCLAQTPSVAMPPGPASLAEFLATLSSGQSDAPAAEVLPPSPRFLTTYCSSNADCPTGELCCYPCGIDGCDFICMTPYRGHCPWIP